MGPRQHSRLLCVGAQVSWLCHSKISERTDAMRQGKRWHLGKTKESRCLTAMVLKHTVLSAVRLNYCWEAPGSVQVSEDTRPSTSCGEFPEAEAPFAIQSKQYTVEWVRFKDRVFCIPISQRHFVSLSSCLVLEQLTAFKIREQKAINKFKDCTVLEDFKGI